jgi:hypothetical protein
MARKRRWWVDSNAPFHKQFSRDETPKRNDHATPLKRAHVEAAQPKKEGPHTLIDLAGLHPIVAAAGKAYRDATPTSEGIFHSIKSSPLSLRVAPVNFRRALLFADKLLKAAEGRGYSVVSGNDKTCQIAVDGEEVAIAIRERLNQRKNAGETFKWRATTLVPSGELTVILGGGYSSKPAIADTTRWKVEDRIEKALEKIAETARNQKERRLEHERWTRKYEAEQRKREEEERRILSEKQKKDDLLAEVSNWKRAEEIRAYIARAREVIAEAGVRPDQNAQPGQKLAWAENYANLLDPLTALRHTGSKSRPADSESRS